MNGCIATHHDHYVWLYSVRLHAHILLDNRLNHKSAFVLVIDGCSNIEHFNDNIKEVLNFYYILYIILHK